MTTPVALVLFNRPNLLREVFARVAESKPETLFLIADGPREGFPKDVALCQESRDVVSQVDWPCKVLTNFSSIHLGCGRRISSGLDWVFSRVEECIVLEDDCVPSSQFFPFCEELLERYRHDERIGIISGDNFVAPHMDCPDSYYFSRYAHVWGWASWRRTWQLFDFQMHTWPEFRRRQMLSQITRRPETVRFWTGAFESHFHHHGSWASRLVLTCFVNGLLNVIPQQNLVTNRGWGHDGTHAKDANHPLANLPTGHIHFPLQHPEFFIPFRDADELVECSQFS